MEAARKYITERGCGDLIDSVFFHRKCRNTLIIFNPRIQDTRDVTDPEEEVELKADLESNNILNGPLTKIRDLERRGCLIQECLDVSLRAYISYLYLKNDSMKIMLSVKETSSHPIEVQTQAYLDKVDRLCKQKHVL